MTQPNDKKEIFETLFKQHFQQLYVHAYNWVYDSECAKDIVHDSFCYLWEHFDRYEDHKNLLALLYSFVYSRCSDYLRHRQASNNYIDYQLTHHQETGTEDYSDSQERLKKVQIAISQLSPQMQLVFTECVLNKKSYKEVGELLNISHLTVKTLVSRAYKVIRKKVFFFFI